jgi:hypothetical protein
MFVIIVGGYSDESPTLRDAFRSAFCIPDNGCKKPRCLQRRNYNEGDIERPPAKVPPAVNEGPGGRQEIMENSIVLAPVEGGIENDPALQEALKEI